jgi:hypothetical protein
VLLGLIGIHVLGSAQLVDTAAKATAVCVLLALALAWSVLQPRWAGLRTRWLPVMLPGVTAAVVLLVLIAPNAKSGLLEPLVAPGAAPALAFPHEPHRQVNCLLCHHNWVDHTGTGSCISCHRESPAALRRSAEATFHVFCRDCHSDESRQGHEHGPTRACSACHHQASH